MAITPVWILKIILGVGFSSLVALADPHDGDDFIVVTKKKPRPPSACEELLRATEEALGHPLEPQERDRLRAEYAQMTGEEEIAEAELERIFWSFSAELGAMIANAHSTHFTNARAQHVPINPVRMSKILDNYKTLTGEAPSKNELLSTELLINFKQSDHPIKIVLAEFFKQHPELRY